MSEPTEVVLLKLFRTMLLRRAWPLSLALVSLGCGGDPKGGVDPGGTKNPLDGDRAKDERDAASSEGDGAGPSEDDGPAPGGGACSKDVREPEFQLSA